MKVGQAALHFLSLSGEARKKIIADMVAKERNSLLDKEVKEVVE